MTLRWMSNAFCCWAFIFFLILIFLFFWYFWEPVKINQNVITPAMSHMKQVALNQGRQDNPTMCTEQTSYTYGIQVCMKSKTIAVVLIPLISLTKRGRKGQDYRSYKWYLTNDRRDTSWSTMVADEGNNWTPEWCTTAYASHQKKLFKFHKADNAIQVTTSCITLYFLPTTLHQEESVGVFSCGSGFQGQTQTLTFLFVNKKLKQLSPLRPQRRE
ncbi:hypothetical protein GOODEAATRI_034631 [Goodea atripinnis]|uniref:Uncharacterized protein n=1 Tax=Goodea atripinnis TaxID=208336 RepID=A0ABV0PJF4_9TELE